MAVNNKKSTKLATAEHRLANANTTIQNQQRSINANIKIQDNYRNSLVMQELAFEEMEKRMKMYRAFVMEHHTTEEFRTWITNRNE